MPDAEARHDITDPVISIGVLADRVGLSVSAVRKYENEGLIIAHRAESGHRLFSHEDISRVRSIQHMIQNLGLNIEGIRRMQALVPCWDLLPCDAQARRSCHAYHDNTGPCWTIRGVNCAPQGNECRRCAVYRFCSMCTPDIKRLLHYQGDADEDAPAGQEMLELYLRDRTAAGARPVDASETGPSAGE